MIYSAEVEDCESLDPVTLFLRGQARYALQDGFAASPVFWLDCFRDGLLWRGGFPHRGSSESCLQAWLGPFIQGRDEYGAESGHLAGPATCALTHTPQGATARGRSEGADARGSAVGERPKAAETAEARPRDDFYDGNSRPAWAQLSCRCRNPTLAPVKWGHGCGPRADRPPAGWVRPISVFTM
jgi:hypothetical protein